MLPHPRRESITGAAAPRRESRKETRGEAAFGALATEGQS